MQTVLNLATEYPVIFAIALAVAGLVAAVAALVSFVRWRRGSMTRFERKAARLAARRNRRLNQQEAAARRAAVPLADSSSQPECGDAFGLDLALAPPQDQPKR